MGWGAESWAAKLALRNRLPWSAKRKNGEIVDLGVLPGDSCSNAYFVNAHGQVVGASENQYFCSILVGQHAFLWQHGGPMVDLNTLIPPGASLDLTYAVAINNRGEIAGFGVPPGCAPEDYEACGHAYVLIPCEEGEKCTNVTLDAASAAPLISSSFSKRPAGSMSATTNLQERWNRLHHISISPERKVPSNK